MKVLNLYAGLGGNRKLWQGVEVTAVELNEQIAEAYQKQYPGDTVIVGDAHQYLLHNYDRFDFVWASPPCQSHTGMVKATRHDVRKYADMKLYEEIILLQQFCKDYRPGAKPDKRKPVKWVIENVKPYYEPLIKPSAVYGRHLFWMNYQMGYFEAPHMPNFMYKGGKEGAEELKKWLGIDYEGTIYYDGNHEPSQVLRNCVHPKLGEYIFNQQNGMFA